MRAVLLTAALLIVAAAASTTLYPASSPPKSWVHQPGLRSDSREVIQMNIGLRRRNMERAEALFWRVSDPKSPEYGDHLDNKGAIELMSPGPEAIQKVMTWLQQHGIVDAKLARHEDYIYFNAPLALIESLLNVRFQVFQHATNGRYLNRALNEVHIPDELAQIIEVIGGHRGFPLPRSVTGSTPMAKKAKAPAPTTAMPVASTTAAPVVTPAPTQTPPFMNVTPEVLRKAYNVSVIPPTPADTYNLQSFFQAQGQYVDPEDMIMFCGSFLPAQFANCSISKFIGPNVNDEPGLESSLDSEYIYSMGWGTETWAYSYSNFDFCGDLMTWAHDVFDGDATKHPYVISMSYGSQSLPNFCAGPDVNRLSLDIMKMGLLGISVMIASGDNGSGEYSRAGYNEGLLAPSMPASIPYCTAVGSTTFVQNINSGEEEATTFFGSGGGFSFDYAQPLYQRDAVAHFFQVSTKLPNPLSYNASGRGTPDVSALGWNFTVVSGGIYQAVGGTSASTPTFSGMVTLLNNVRLQNKKTLGFLNPLLYQNPQAFTDIVTGNNDANADGYGWYCVPGWDPATGLGTLNFGHMVEVIQGINAQEQARGADRKRQL